MIISFAFGLIGALLVLANNKYLRIFKISIFAFFIASGIAALGIYFIQHAPRETDSSLFFPLFTPLVALTLMHFTRLIYRKRMHKEIILHIHGLFPVKDEERYVTRSENYITFILLLFSVLIPFLTLLFIK